MASIDMDLTGAFRDMRRAMNGAAAAIGDCLDLIAPPGDEQWNADDYRFLESEAG